MKRDLVIPTPKHRGVSGDSWPTNKGRARLQHPRVRTGEWHTDAGATPVVEIRAGAKTIRVPLDHARRLCDELHDAADSLERSTPQPQQEKERTP